MNESELNQEIEKLTETISRAVRHWDERTPTLIASSLQEYSIPTVLEIISRTPETRNEEELNQTLAKMVLSRYAKADSDLDEFRSELWEVFEADDRRLPLLQVFLRHTQEFAMLQSRSPGSKQIYIELKKICHELLVQLRQKPLRQYPRRRRRTYTTVKVARTAELPELSQLTLQPIDGEPLVEKKGTGTLTTLPASIRLPSSRGQKEVLVELSLIPELETQFPHLLEWLPEIYELLENWEPDRSPFDLAETLHSLSPEELLRFSAYLLPHENQVDYLRYIGILIHLKLLSETPLPYLKERLRIFISIDDPQVEPIMSAVLYYMYCCSHTFYAIQEQAIKKLGHQRSYLYHLITQEWHQNKIVNNFLKVSLSKSEQRAVKHLSPLDWKYIFLILNQNWASSVIRDVYGVFHGSSFFAHQIVQPDTSVGFGDLKETGKGVSFTLATQQISDILKSHGHKKVESEVRSQKFEQFVQERFKKEVLRKEPRPNLNVSSLKRLERFVANCYQRGQTDHIGLDTLAFLVAKESLMAYAYLTPDRMGWFIYELTRYMIKQLPSLEERDFTLYLKGYIHAVMDIFTHEFFPRRGRESWRLSQVIWESLFYSLMDQGYLKFEDPETTQNLGDILSDILKGLQDKYLEEPRKQFFEAFAPVNGL